MTDNEIHHFEGPEKKVELAVCDGYPDLRTLSPSFWEAVVRAAKADILSSISNEHCDAYLLSESSLFVFSNFVTMITCGRTTLVDAVAMMLTRIDHESVAALIYERKNENFPHEQPSSFFDDARTLAELLPGRAVRVGSEHEHAIRFFQSTAEHDPDDDDVTVEILMHGIAPQVGVDFRRAESRSSDEPSIEVGLNEMLAAFTIDEHLFEPYGYSLNGLRDRFYVTIHVTPQAHGSYVSFETNDPELCADVNKLVAALSARFSPESFDVLVFSPGEKPSVVGAKNYRLRQHILHSLCGYELRFQHFYRPPSEPGRAIDLVL